MLRGALKATLFLLLGALLSMAMAVLCSLWYSTQPKLALRSRTVEEGWASWFGSAPSGFPRRPNYRLPAIEGWGYSRFDLRAQYRVQNPNPPPLFEIAEHSQVLAFAGWPLTTLTGSSWELPDGSSQDHGLATIPKDTSPSMLHSDVVLPLRPYWPGFIPSIFLYALICWVLWMLLSLPRVVRRAVRMFAWRCAGCGYPVSATCSECGTRTPVDKAAKGPAAGKAPG